MAKCIWNKQTGKRKCINCGYEILIDTDEPIDRVCHTDVLQSSKCFKNTNKPISKQQKIKPHPERILELIRLMSQYLLNIKRKNPTEYEPQLEVCKICDQLGNNGCLYQRDGCNAGPQTQWSKNILNKDCPVLINYEFK
jgi:hypothetical protein